MGVKSITLLLISACVVQQFLQVNSLKDRRTQQGGKGRRRGQRNEIGPKVSSGTGGHSGRFSVKDGAQCSWVAAGEGDKFVLGVTCKNGSKSFECKYVAKPTACQQYSSSAEAYWKQIARSLRRQKRLCRESKATIKASVCRNAPREAHFRMMKTRSEVQAPAPGPPPLGNIPCPDRMDRLKLAEEYCTSSWSSLCTFMFLMFENDEC